MKHLFEKSLFILGALLFGPALAYGATFLVIQGGTGTTTPSGILYGDNGSTNHVNTVKIGSNLTFSGGTLSATGGGTGSVATSSAETSGRIPFWTSTSASPATLSGGSASFVWDNTNNRLGVGTTTPGAPLSVVLGSDYLSHAAQPAFLIASSSAGTATTTFLSITADGRVGIATSTNLSTALTVAGNGGSMTNVLSGWAVSIVPGANGSNAPLLGFGNGVSSAGSNVFAGGISNTSTGLNLVDRDQSIRITEQRGGTTIAGTNDVNYNNSTTDIALTITPNTLGAAASWSAENPTLTVGGQSFTIGGTSFAAQRFIKFAQPTITATTTNNSITATSSNVYINGAPIIGGSATTSLSAGLYVDSGTSIGTGATNAYGLYVAPPFGATNNYGAYIGGNVGIGSTSPGTNLGVTGNGLFSALLTAARYVVTGFSAGFAPSVNGEFGISTTDNQWKYEVGGVVQVLSPLYFASYPYATSTAWTGTTTRQLGPVPVNQTWKWAKCFTDVGSVQVSFNDGSNRMDWINASTTVGTTTFSTNNNLTSSSKRYIDLGTPLSSPTQVSCTVAYTINGD